MHALESSLLQSVDQQLNNNGLPTQFGPTKIDLTGLTARKAMMMFQATAGRERTAWGEVTYFLTQREAENLVTLRLVTQAVRCAEDEQWEQALNWLERALQSWPSNCDNHLLLEYRDELQHCAVM